jgi:hypothetical protein
MAGAQQAGPAHIGIKTYGVGEPGVEETRMSEATGRILAKILLQDAISELEALNPQPESAPGPEQTEAGRNSQALSLMKAALPWLEDAK